VQYGIKQAPALLVEAAGSSEMLNNLSSIRKFADEHAATVNA